MYKAYKFRLYPDENQKTLINKNTECARLVYSLLLSDRKVYYKECGGMLKREVSYYKNLPEYAFLKEADSLALANAKLHLEAAYKNFFERRTGFPKFRIKGKDDSYTTNVLCLDISCIYMLSALDVTAFLFLALYIFPQHFFLNITSAAGKISICPEFPCSHDTGITQTAAFVCLNPPVKSLQHSCIHGFAKPVGLR